MSLQIFLHGKILGIEQFLTEASADFEGRAQWATLLSEVLPRALLAELRLSNYLLGSSGGGQFLVVLPQETRAQAQEFCESVSAALRCRSNGTVRLAWGMTENLGDWTDIRKRLLSELHANMGAPGFDPLQPESQKFPRFEEAARAAWSPEDPASINPGEGKHSWAFGNGPDDIPFARHTAAEDDESAPAGLTTLATRADGRWLAGVLRGDVDAFGVRLRRSASVEEHLQLSMMYKQFFVGELQIRCALPEYWRKVKLLAADGQDFAVAGSWDALIGLAREIQRIFQIFVEANLKDYPGIEGKTISMAIALGTSEDATITSLFAEAGEKLELAKASGRDSIWVLGRTLEWKQLGDAAELKDTMARMIREFRVPRQLLDELGAFYKGTGEAVLTPGARRTNARVDRPWRFYRRLNVMLAGARGGKDFQRLRADLISDFTGRRASNVRLRPQGRVALEWAKLETEHS